MKRTAFDARRDQQTADSYLGDHFACRWCNAMTHRHEMEAFGARCRACWDAYLAEKNPGWVKAGRTLSHEERQRMLAWIRQRMAELKVARQAGGVEWARRLEQREAAGDRLSGAQREAWRVALRVMPAEVA